MKRQMMFKMFRHKRFSIKVYTGNIKQITKEELRLTRTGSPKGPPSVMVFIPIHETEHPIEVKK